MIILFIWTIIASASCHSLPQATTWGLDFLYHDQWYLEDFLRNTAYLYPKVASLYSIGRSAKGRELYVIKLSGPSTPSVGVPHVKLIGNIHGNEPAGREVLLHFIEYLVRSYDDDPEVQKILDSTVLHILPSMNPDGFANSLEGKCQMGDGRHNGNDIDLNRNFPDFYVDSQVTEPETAAVIEWMKKYQFVLSASLHGGSVVANYPLDYSPNSPPDLMEYLQILKKNNTGGQLLMDLLQNFTDQDDGAEHFHSRVQAPSPDDDVFIHLAHVYADNHLTMHKGEPCPGGSPFPGGITNGAAWYSLKGGMQDYNYLRSGCMELTLEISCCKYPSAKKLPIIWKENKEALIEFVKEANHGVRGLVQNSVTGEGVEGATLSIVGRNSTFFTSEKGEFWRILLPGNYIIQLSAPGYNHQEVPFYVKRLATEYPHSTWLNIHLEPAKSQRFAEMFPGMLNSQSPSTPAGALFLIALTACRFLI